MAMNIQLNKLIIIMRGSNKCLFLTTLNKLKNSYWNLYQYGLWIFFSVWIFYSNMCLNKKNLNLKKKSEYGQCMVT